MKTEFIDVSDTEKNLRVEIPSSVVDAEIERVTRDYGRAARIPGFRPGKVPARIVRQRFRDQILHDVAHDLIPRAIDEALRESGQEPVNTPDVKNVTLQEGQPLTFTASFETVPAIEPVDYGSIVLRRTEKEVSETDVDEALERLRERNARYEPVEDRPAGPTDAVTVDLERRPVAGSEAADTEAAPPSRHENVTVEIGAPANPPGLDEQLVGATPGTAKTFTLRYPDDYGSRELAGTEVEYSVAVKAIKQRVLPALDDEFARDMGEFDSLAALRERVAEDLRHHARHEADREVRADLLRQLAARVTFAVPASLVDREVDRRLEEFVRRLIEQQVDPMRANIDWEEFRTRQREPAAEAVRSALVLDEVARREGVTIGEADVAAEIERYAARSGRTPAAVRAQLEKEGGIGRIYAGLRRDRAIDLLLSRVTLVAA
jgi:trigger factor